MHIRPAGLAVCVAMLALTLSLATAPNAAAQTTDPDITGHGSCSLAPGTEPCTGLNALSFDSFLLDRASRLVLAATRWQPTFNLRAAAPSRSRPLATWSRVSR